jgi:hypothetical protein
VVKNADALAPTASTPGDTSAVDPEKLADIMLYLEYTVTVADIMLYLEYTVTGRA